MALFVNSLCKSVSFVLRTTKPKVSNIRFLNNSSPALNKKEIEITFIKHDGTKIKAKGKIGESFLDVVVNNSIDLEGYGACEGTLTCSTCHLIFDKKDYDQLPQKQVEENDMLELARDCCETSRLGCQIPLTEEMDGIVVNVPEATNDARLE